MIDRHLMPSSVNRRAFLTKAGMTAAAFSIPRITHARNVSEAESTPLDVAALFEASSPDVLALAKRVMENSSKFASADSNASTIGIGASATSTTTA